MTLQRENAVVENRKLMGATNPVDAEEGTLRKKYGISIDKNSVHEQSFYQLIYRIFSSKCPPLRQLDLLLPLTFYFPQQHFLVVKS